MKVGIPKERRANETRVAATPETVKKLKGLGLEVVVEAGAGAPSHFADQDYAQPVPPSVRPPTRSAPTSS